MRIIGFSKMWDKLEQPEFTTFRFKRKDKDWEIGELVLVFYKPRSPKREYLGLARIISKEYKRAYDITDDEAIKDGFRNLDYMLHWLMNIYKDVPFGYAFMNKLTLRWE